MNKATTISQATEKYFSKKVVNYIVGKKLCQDCAREEWKDEDKDQRLNIYVGICEKCKKGTLVAYMEK